MNLCSALDSRRQAGNAHYAVLKHVPNTKIGEQEQEWIDRKVQKLRRASDAELSRTACMHSRSELGLEPPGYSWESFRRPSVVLSIKYLVI